MVKRGHRYIAAASTVALALLGYLGVQVAVGAPAQAATGQFHGVNWADARDNFLTTPNIPIGLSMADSYATTRAKSTGILKGFQKLGANTVRMGINPQTTSSKWWSSLTAAYDEAAALGMNVMIAPWRIHGNGGITDMKAFWAMWDVVIKKYGGNSHFYFDILNEPADYNAKQWTDIAASFVSRYSSKVPRARIVVAGHHGDKNMCAVGKDSRLNGTTLSLHIYSMFGDKHTTEADWVTDLKNNLCGFASRTIVTEFGVPMTTRVNYNGPRNGDNNISYLYGVTDTVRSMGIGSIVWTGLRNRGQTRGPGPCNQASCAITTIAGSGTNLSLTVNNKSGLDRIQHGWGR
jgi:hypothetical protein